MRACGPSLLYHKRSYVIEMSIYIRETPYIEKRFVAEMAAGRFSFEKPPLASNRIILPPAVFCLRTQGLRP